MQEGAIQATRLYPEPFEKYAPIKYHLRLHILILPVIDDVPQGGAFEVHETGWGEFEITIKLYYVPESNEKPQTLYHHLRLHPYGDTEEAKEAMRKEEVIKSWVYEEQLFNEPYNEFYDILTSPMDRGKGGGKGTRVMKGGMVGSVGERTASIPLTTRPDQPFSRETERMEIKRLMEANAKVKELQAKLTQDLREKEAEYQALGGQKLIHR